MAEHHVLFSIAGLQRLLGPPAEVTRKIGEEWQRLGGTGNVAVASSLEAAELAAQGFPGVTFIEPGREGEVLGALPLAFLPLPADLAEALDQWGLTHLADVAALDAKAVAVRLGEPGIRLHRLACGAGLRPLRVDEHPPEFFRELDLEDAEELLEPLLFLLHRFLGELCDALTGQGYAAQNIHLYLHHRRQAPTARSLQLPFPSRDARLLAKLIQLHLEAHPFPEAVTRVELRLDAVQPRTQQDGLFRAASPSPEKLELTLQRLGQLTGLENVGRAQLIDTHRPRPFELVRFAPPEGRDPLLAFTEATPAVTLRLLNPVVEAQVRFEVGQPASVRSALVSGEVTRAAGPWKTSGHWWDEHRWNWEEWDVAIANQGLYRLVWEPLRKRWFFEGYYD